VKLPIAPAQIGPGAALAGRHPHRVVELDVAGAGVAGAAEGADQAEGAGGGLHDVRLEEVLGGVGGGAEDEKLEDRSSPGWSKAAANSAKVGGWRRMNRSMISQARSIIAS
jgi:hypothetical protein